MTKRRNETVLISCSHNCLHCIYPDCIHQEDKPTKEEHAAIRWALRGYRWEWIDFYVERMVRAGKNEKEIISALGISVNDYRGSRQRIKRKKD